MGLLLVPLVSFLLGLATGRWGVLCVPVLVLSGLAVFLVLNGGWYGYGWGEFGVAWNLFVAGVTLGAAATGVALRRWTGGPRTPGEATMAARR